MKSKAQITTMMLAVLAELHYYDPKTVYSHKILYKTLRTQLETICKILEDDIPEEYIEEIEKYIEL